MWDNVHVSSKGNSSGFLSMKAIPDLLLSRDLKKKTMAVFQIHQAEVSFSWLLELSSVQHVQVLVYLTSYCNVIFMYVYIYSIYIYINECILHLSDTIYF